MDDAGLSYRFVDFFLDVINRKLWPGNARGDLNGRYVDALVLLVRGLLREGGLASAASASFRPD